MKLTFNAGAAVKKIAETYKNRLEPGLETLKEYIDEGTPELSRELIEHNKIEKPTFENMQVTWAVYNDLWDYEHDVEDGMGDKPFTYHKYKEWSNVVADRDEISYWVWAKMFERWFEAAKTILLDYLRNHDN